MLKGPKYKLQMLRTDIMENATNCLGNNNVVILNLSVLESTLNNKNNYFTYKYVQEAIASGMSLI